MLSVEVFHELTDAQVADVVALVGTVQSTMGHRPLSDQQWLDLTAGGRSELHAAMVFDDTEGRQRLVGYGQISSGNETWTIETVVVADVPVDERCDIASRLIGAARMQVASHGGGPLHWWVFEPGDGLSEVAHAHGLGQGRTLHQMRASLPLTVPTREPVEVRPFRIGEDERDWLIVNNAAFADHPEQGGWTMETVRQREREPWFEPEGFLLHHRDGRLAAFCWTKIHRDERPVLGEIYVIAVHPDFRGLGLGKALTVAGLRSIAERGITDAMLFVDGDNTAAFEMYVHLGFAIQRTDRAFVGNIEREVP